MTPEKLSWVRRRAWDKRREMYGPRGHRPKQAWRRQPGSRAKRVSTQPVEENVTRGTEPT